MPTKQNLQNQKDIEVKLGGFATVTAPYGTRIAGCSDETQTIQNNMSNSLPNLQKETRLRKETERLIMIAGHSVRPNPLDIELWEDHIMKRGPGPRLIRKT